MFFTSVNDQYRSQCQCQQQIYIVHNRKASNAEYTYMQIVKYRPISAQFVMKCKLSKSEHGRQHCIAAVCVCCSGWISVTVSRVSAARILTTPPAVRRAAVKNLSVTSVYLHAVLASQLSLSLSLSHQMQPTLPPPRQSCVCLCVCGQ